jgi:hypothetical protein
MNMSGSCCGLMDKPYFNSELHNWSKGQLAYHLSEMRKKYLQTAVPPKLYFNQILQTQANNWLDETKFYGDSLKTFEGGFSRSNMNFGYEFRQCWNNLRSPANPYNYFHGKLKPIGLDEDKNIVYQYVPDDYEAYWHALGLI